MEGFADQNGREGDERAAKQARRKHGGKRSTKVPRAGDFLHVRKQTPSVKCVVSGRPVGSAGENPKRYPDKRNIRRGIEREARDGADARHQYAGDGGSKERDRLNCVELSARPRPI